MTTALPNGPLGLFPLRTVLFPGMSRSRSSSALTLAACLGLLACTPPLMVGAPCALPSDCPEAYTCLLGRCRTECATNRDCSVGGAVGMCLVDEVTGLRACRTVEEESCTMTCGEGLSCIGGRCAQTCEETSECSGTLCRTAGPVRACLEPTATTCVACAARSRTQSIIGSPVPASRWKRPVPFGPRSRAPSTHSTSSGRRPWRQSSSSATSSRS